MAAAPLARLRVETSMLDTAPELPPTLVEVHFSGPHLLRVSFGESASPWFDLAYRPTNLISPIGLRI